MIDLAITEFHIDVPALPKKEFQEYTTNLFDIWDSYVEKSLNINDYSVELYVEEGSIKGMGKVGAALGVIYAGICGYGSFIQGLDIIHGQVKSVSDYLAAHASSGFKAEGHPTKIRKHGGALSQLQRLFIRVQRQEISVEQAMIEADRLLGEEARSNPDFINQLRSELSSAPKFPEQLDFSDLEEGEGIFLPFEGNTLPRPTRSPRPKPIPPPSQQFRIEVRRNSKNGERLIKIIEL